MSVLICRAVSKHFGGVRALEGIDLEVRRGEIVGLVGPNGSGKTTLLSVIGGSLLPDAGTVEFNGSDITRARPHSRARAGIARTFQIPRPLGSMTVLENVALPCMFGRHRESRAAALARAQEVLVQVGLESVGHRMPTELTLHERKFLEVARALALSPELLLLDEVLAGLNPTEAAAGAGLIERVRDSGVSVIYIEHNVKTVTRLADRVYVLNRGRNLADGLPGDVIRDERVVSAYLGGAHA